MPEVRHALQKERKEIKRAKASGQRQRELSSLRRKVNKCGALTAVALAVLCGALVRLFFFAPGHCVLWEAAAAEAAALARQEELLRLDAEDELLRQQRRAQREEEDLQFARAPRPPLLADCSFSRPPHVRFRGPACLQ